MDQSAQERWQELHVRVVRGEALDAEQRTLYETTLRQLDQSEHFKSLQSAKQAREDLRLLEAERSRLEERRLQLNVDIKSLEGMLSQQARQSLSAGG